MLTLYGPQSHILCRDTPGLKGTRSTFPELAIPPSVTTSSVWQLLIPGPARGTPHHYVMWYIPPKS